MTTTVAENSWIGAEELPIEEFIDLVGRARSAHPSYRFACEVSAGIPVYHVPILDLSQQRNVRALQNEWIEVLARGAGVLLFREAFDPEVVDRCSQVFFHLIAEEKKKKNHGDHFASAGANDRVWNALQKLCYADPEVFISYYSNSPLALVAEAWLGEGYQLTSQLNNVRPGGKAQNAHRDYHLGFMDQARARKFPLHVHQLSPFLTLQGAIAHVDMPLESGPTKLLPFSQLYPYGYAAVTQEDFVSFFEKRHVQLPLKKGDAVFFNPALFHAAGANVSQDINRLANLVQLSSPFGRAMEAVDRRQMGMVLYPHLLASSLGMPVKEKVVAAALEGYSFPSNLDKAPPVGGLVAPSPAQITQRALTERWTERRYQEELDDAYRWRIP